MNRQAEMFVRKDYSIIALAESLKRAGDQRKARFECSLSGMTLDLLPAADRFHGAAIPSIAFARDLEVWSQAGGQAIVSSSVLPVAAATRPQTILEKGHTTFIIFNRTFGPIGPICGHVLVFMDAVVDIDIQASRFTEQNCILR